MTLDVRDPRWEALERSLPRARRRALEMHRSVSPSLAPAAPIGEPSARVLSRQAPVAGGDWLKSMLPIVAPQLEQLRAPIDRLEQLERELVALMATAAPSTWSSCRRQLVRVLRTARRELRTSERRSLIGDVS